MPTASSLAIAPSEVDRALSRLSADVTSAAGHIEVALEITSDPADKERLERLAELVKSYVGVVGELAAAARDYGDTVDKVKRSENGIIVDPITLPPDATVGRAREIMSGHHISGVPITALVRGSVFSS